MQPVVGDSQRLRKMYIESSQSESLLNADAISSKTSLTLDAKTRFIPYTALGYGVGGDEDWAQKWLQSRVAEGLLMGEYTTWIPIQKASSLTPENRIHHSTPRCS